MDGTGELHVKLRKPGSKKSKVDVFSHVEARLIRHEYLSLYIYAYIYIYIYIYIEREREKERERDCISEFV
jgi:hypothetical protein